MGLHRKKRAAPQWYGLDDLLQERGNQPFTRKEGKVTRNVDRLSGLLKP